MILPRLFLSIHTSGWVAVFQPTNLITQTKNDTESTMEYEHEEALVIARFIEWLDAKATTKEKCFMQQYLLQQGLKKFGERGTAASSKEIGQLHNRTVFGPILVNELTPTERKKAMEALMFLCEKRDGTVKCRMVYNGKPT